MTITLDHAILGLIVEQLRLMAVGAEKRTFKRQLLQRKRFCTFLFPRPLFCNKHGPYSFDVTAMLMSMRADRVLSLVPQSGYGPSFTIETAMKSIYDRYRSEIEQIRPKIEKVASHFGPKNVSDLERVATAIYVTLKRPHDSIEARATELNRVKPHIKIPVALSSVAEADQFFQIVSQVGNAA